MLYVPQWWAKLCVLICAISKLSLGLRALNLSRGMGRVVGGHDAVVNSAPFIVSLQYKGTHYCGGTIINKNWVLTAAHCLSSRATVKDTTLIAGSINVAGRENTTQKHAIEYYVVNELYLGGTSPYDVGLIYTKTPFIWSNAVRAVTLAGSNYTPSGNAFLYGWGSTSKSDNALYPTILQIATVPIISRDACELALGAQGNEVHITNLCTGPLSGGAGVCISDSGGPLIQNVNGKSIQVGVVSWGKRPCGQKNAPSVYVQVSSVLLWIEKNQVIP